MTSSNINHHCTPIVNLKDVPLLPIPFSLILFPHPSSLSFLSTSFLKTLRLSTLKSRERLWWAESSSDCSLPSPHGWVCSDDVIGSTVHGKPMEVVTSCQLWSIGRCWENPRSFWLLFLRNLDNWHSQQAQTWVRDGSNPYVLKSSFLLYLLLFSTFSPRLFSPLPTPYPPSSFCFPSPTGRGTGNCDNSMCVSLHCTTIFGWSSELDCILLYTSAHSWICLPTFAHFNTSTYICWLHSA